MTLVVSTIAPSTLVKRFDQAKRQRTTIIKPTAHRPFEDKIAEVQPVIRHLYIGALNYFGTNAENAGDLSEIPAVVLLVEKGLLSVEDVVKYTHKELHALLTNNGAHDIMSDRIHDGANIVIEGLKIRLLTWGLTLAQ